MVQINQATNSNSIQNNYSGHLLRNFTVVFLDNYLKNETTSLWKSKQEYFKEKGINFTENGFLTLSNLLEKIISNGYDDTDLEKFLFNALNFILPDRHCIYNFTPNNYTAQSLANSIELVKYLNKPIYFKEANSDMEKLQLISAREEKNSIILLLRKGFTKDEDIKKTIFFISCEINFEHNFFIIKFRETFKNHSSHSSSALIKEVTTYIQNLLNHKIVITAYDKNENIKSKLYDLFHTETTRSDKIILSKLPMNEKLLENKIKVFIDSELNLQGNKTITKQNSDIIKSMYCLNIAKTLSNSLFKERYIFAYSFTDGTTTRSITRDSKRNHIYARNLYWSLKSTVIKESKIDEISLYYKINKVDFKKDPVGSNFFGLEVTFKAQYGGLFVKYYTNSIDTERGFKSGFTLYELKKYI